MKRFHLQMMNKYPTNFLKVYHFMFHIMSSLVTWDVVGIRKTHVESNILYKKNRVINCNFKDFGPIMSIFEFDGKMTPW